MPRLAKSTMEKKRALIKRVKELRKSGLSVREIAGVIEMSHPWVSAALNDRLYKGK